MSHERALAPDGPWQPFVADPGGAALLVDFDGTLAPIVDDPDRAAPLPLAVDALGRLSERLAVVAVVTGRPVAHVRRYLTAPRVVVVGQYGLERDDGDGVVADPRAAPFAEPVAAAAAEAARRWPRLRVERKGTVAVTLHWRTVADAAPPAEALERLAADHGLAAFPGRLACELRPALPVDKGTATAALLAEADPAVAAFAGDDHGDLAAFAALATWGDAAEGRTALRIAVASEESPPGLSEAADLVVDGPETLAGMLSDLAGALESVR